MGFLNPFFLFGILAATIPLIIHLWSRRQAKTVDFSSLMFLLVAHRQSVRRVQLKNLFILLLRMAIIIIIALALARPLINDQFSFAGVRAKTSVVVILDNSFSMRYQGIQGQRFEKAKVIAGSVVESLRPGDSVAFILMSNIGNAVLRKLTKNLNAATQEIGQASVSNRSTHVFTSLDLAHDILHASDDPNKEIYLISDFGRNGWENLNRVSNRSGAKIFLLPVGDEVGDNTSVDEFYPSSQLLGAHLPVQLNMNVTNHSDLSPQETILTLFVDGRKRRSIGAHLEAREAISPSLIHKFGSAGLYTGHVDLTPDRLSIDNRRFFAFHVYGQIRVLCVGEQTLYVSLALDPGNQLTLSADFAILPTNCALQEIGDFALEDFDVLILADVPEFSNRVRQSIQKFVREGKGVIYFVSRKVSATRYNEFLDWLPAKLGTPVFWSPPFTISKFNAKHPIFEIFKTEEFSGQYAPQFYRGLNVHPVEDANVIAELTDGTPFLVERPIESGVAFLFNVSATKLDASTLMVNPHFVSLLHQTVLYTKAIQSDHNRNLLVGQAFAANYRHTKATKASVRRVGEPTLPPEIVPISEDGSMQFNRTEYPGIYQVDVLGRNQLSRDFFAVNVEPAESDLRRIEIQEAMERIGAQPEFTGEPEPLNLALNANRVGREVWGELLVVALILMLLEGLMSNSKSIGFRKTTTES